MSHSTLYVAAGAAAVGGVDPGDRALVVTGDRITWTGPPERAPDTDEVVDLGSAWLAPGFVDAHIHATATGLAALGLDLRSIDSVAALLDAVQTHAAATDHTVVYGAGWDDLCWPEGRLPHAEELAQAAPGKTVVLVRVDGHSCLVDARTLARLDLREVAGDVDRDRDGQPTGWLLEAANGRAWTALWEALTPRDLTSAREATCARALELGITTVHEMGIPALSTQDDTLTWAAGRWPVTVHAYWAALDVDLRGPLLPGGDLFLDGSIGSCTAATSAPYRTNDGAVTTGELFHPDDVIADFFVAATRAGRGAGVHAIGDRAVAQAVAALQRAASICGLTAVRQTRHRIEHAEVVTRDQIAALARLGVVASVQPAFDATWNGPGGLYRHRFGADAADTNPFSWFAEAGVAMCFASDSTVTPMDPWGGVLAAESHHGGHRLDRRTAFEAATLGGHHAVGAEDQAGALVPGHRADFVAWPGDPLTADPSGWAPVIVVARGRRHQE